jgi:excisionase family DNA binding protein
MMATVDAPGRVAGAYWMEKLMLSKSEAGQALGVSLRTIDRLISSGQIATRRIGRRVLIYRSEVEKLTRLSSQQLDKSLESGSSQKRTPNSALSKL